MQRAEFGESSRSFGEEYARKWRRDDQVFSLFARLVEENLLKRLQISRVTGDGHHFVHVSRAM